MNGVSYRPEYIALHRSGELRRRGEALWEMIKNCNLCPRECRVNRLEGKTGFCKASSKHKVASYSPHFGEERSLVGAGLPEYQHIIVSFIPPRKDYIQLVINDCELCEEEIHFDELAVKVMELVGDSCVDWEVDLTKITPKRKPGSVEF